MLIGLILLLAPFIYTFFYFASYNPLFLSVLYGHIMFWGINSIIFFISRFIKPIDIWVVFFIHLFFLIIFIYRKKKYSGFRFDRKDVISFAAMLVSLLLFGYASSHFGRIIPVPSGSWDMAVHYLFTTDVFKTGAIIAPFYPYGFHSNAAIFINSLSLIAGNPHSILLNISGFSVFIFITQALLMGVFIYLLSLILEENDKQAQNMKNAYFVFGLVIPALFYFTYIIYLLWEGFISVLFFNLVFLLFVVLELKSESSSGKGAVRNYIITGLVVFLLGISYFYYLPVFFLYFLTRGAVTKKKEYLLYAGIYFFSCFDLIRNIVFQFSSFSLLTRQYGWFEPFPAKIFLLFVVGAVFAYVITIKKFKTGVLTLLLVYFLLFCFGIGTGVNYYHFDVYLIFKAFIPLFGICILLTSVLFMNVWKKVAAKKYTNYLAKPVVVSEVLSLTALVFIFIMSETRMPGLYTFINGGTSFFPGNHQVRGYYVKAWENALSYDVIIPLEANLNRLRWWSSILKEKTPLAKRMNDRYDQFSDMEYYLKEVSLLQNKKVLIVDASNYLIKSCNSYFINKLLATKNKVDFIPLLDKNALKKCQK